MPRPKLYSLALRPSNTLTRIMRMSMPILSVCLPVVCGEAGDGRVSHERVAPVIAAAEAAIVADRETRELQIVHRGVDVAGQARGCEGAKPRPWLL